MRAIAESRLTDRNDIIDWLRHRGFTFPRASWLERIYHNGGRLVYAHAATVDLKASPHELAEDLAALASPAPFEPDVPETPIAEPGRRAGQTDLSSQLAGAKGLRPLAVMILAEIQKAIPHLLTAPSGSYVELSAPKPFAALLAEPKVLRIYADFGSNPGAPAKTAEAAHRKGLVPYPSVVEVNDARRVDAAFITLILAANARINGDRSG